MKPEIIDEQASAATDSLNSPGRKGKPAPAGWCAPVLALLIAKKLEERRLST